MRLDYELSTILNPNFHHFSYDVYFHQTQFLEMSNQKNRHSHFLCSRRKAFLFCFIKGTLFLLSSTGEQWLPYWGTMQEIDRLNQSSGHAGRWADAGALRCYKMWPFQPVGWSLHLLNKAWCLHKLLKGPTEQTNSSVQQQSLSIIAAIKTWLGHALANHRYLNQAAWFTLVSSKIESNFKWVPSPANKEPGIYLRLENQSLV